MGEVDGGLLAIRRDPKARLRAEPLGFDRIRLLQNVVIGLNAFQLDDCVRLEVPRCERPIGGMRGKRESDAIADPAERCLASRSPISIAGG